MMPANDKQRAVLFAATLIAFFSCPTILSDACAQKTTVKPPATKIEKTLQQELPRLRQEKQYEKALELLNGLEAKIVDRNSWDYRRVLGARAGVWQMMGKEEGWRRDLDTLASVPIHRNIALATKAYYLAIAENEPTLDESQNCLNMIDRNSVDRRDLHTISSTEFHLARRKRDFPAQLRAAQFLNKLNDNAGTRTMVAVSLAHCKRMKESRDWFESAAKVAENRSEAFLQGANVLSGDGDMKGAMQLSKQSIHEDPGAPAPAFCLVSLLEALAGQGKSVESAKPILLAIDDKRCTRKERQKKYLQLSQEAQRSGQVSTAFKYASKADSILSNDETWAQLAGLYNSAANYPQAIIWYQRVVAVRPKDTGALNHLAICFARQEEPEKGIEYCTRVLLIEPNNIAALKTRAALLIVQDRTSEAKIDAKRLQQLEPDKDHSIDTLRALGAKYTSNLIEYYHSATESWKQDDKERLAEVEKRLASASGRETQASLFQEASRLELAIGDYEKCYENALKSIDLGNRAYRVHAIAAAALFALHRKDEAKAERQLAVSLYHEQRSKKSEYIVQPKSNPK